MSKVTAEDRRDKWEVYSNTESYKNMSKSQKAMLNHGEKNGMYGAKRLSKEEVSKWQKKRANMTEEEIESMEAEAALKGSKAGKGFLIGVAAAIAIAVIYCITISQ